MIQDMRRRGRSCKPHHYRSENIQKQKTPAENSEGLVNNRKGCVILIRRQLQPLKRGLYRLRLWRRGRGQQIQ